MKMRMYFFSEIMDDNFTLAYLHNLHKCVISDTLNHELDWKLTQVFLALN